MVATLILIALGVAPAIWCLYRIGRMLRFLYLQRQDQRRLTLTVHRVRRQGQTVLLTLKAPNGRKLPKALPGQHLLLFCKDLQGKPVSRAYSLCHDTTRRNAYRLAIKAEPNGKLSAPLVSTIAVGDSLVTSWPRGHFLLNNSKSPLVLIAAGVGITPMLAMAYAAIRQKRPVTLWYQARTEADLYFHSLLRRLPVLNYHPVLSQSTPDWQGQRGRLNAQVILSNAMPNSMFYCCASPAMTEQLAEALSQQGEQLQFELFSAPLNNNSFPITLGNIIADSAGTASVLDALNSAGANIPFDCRGGSCGLCKMRLVSGEIKQVLEAASALNPGEVLTCCIQPKSAIELAS